MPKSYFVHCNDGHNSRGIVTLLRDDDSSVNYVVDDIVELFNRNTHGTSQCTITAFDVTDFGWKPDATIGSELADNLKNAIKVKPVLEQTRIIGETVK